MADVKDNHPGIEFVSEQVAHELLCGKDHTHPLRKLGVLLLLLPILPPLLVWVFRIHTLFFAPAAVLSIVLWVWLMNWVRYENRSRRYTITEDSAEYWGQPVRLDLWLLLIGGAVAAILLLALPIKILIEVVF